MTLTLQVQSSLVPDLWIATHISDLSHLPGPPCWLKMLTAGWILQLLLSSWSPNNTNAQQAEWMMWHNFFSVIVKLDWLCRQVAYIWLGKVKEQRLPFPHYHLWSALNPRSRETAQRPTDRTVVVLGSSRCVSCVSVNKVFLEKRTPLSAKTYLDCKYMHLTHFMAHIVSLLWRFYCASICNNKKAFYFLNAETI